MFGKDIFLGRGYGKGKGFESEGLEECIGGEVGKVGKRRVLCWFGKGLDVLFWLFFREGCCGWWCNRC